MSDKEKLVELLQSSPVDHEGNRGVGALADHLIANGVTIQRWIPVTERLPEKDVPVLVLSGGHCYVAEWYTWHVGSIGINSWSMPQYVAPPSHWMPLPEPPKGE